MEKYDVIIIGTGIGGLTAASLLAKEGKKKVLMLEQNNVIGGLTSGFYRHGYYMEAGTLGINMQSYFKQLLADIDPALPDEVHDQNYKYVINNHICDKRSIKEVAEQFELMFPEHKKEVKKLFDFVQKYVPLIRKFLNVFDHYSYFKKNFFQKAWVILKLTPIILTNLPFFIYYFPQQLNQILKRIFGSIDTNPGYYFTNMSYYYNPPLFMFLGMWMEYERGLGGAKNGYLELAEKIAKVAVDHGAVLMKRQKVKKILIKNGAAYGVATKDGEFYADKIISNIDLKKLILDMCPDFTFKKSLIKRLQEVHFSESGLILYLGVKMTNDEVKKYIPETEMLYVNEKFTKVNDIFEYIEVCSLQISPSYYLSGERVKEGGTSIIVHVSIPPHLHAPWWDLPKEEYKEVKAKLKELLMNRLECFIPNIKEKTEVADLATPKTLENWVNCSMGASSGFSWVHKKSFMKTMSMTKMYTKTPVKNLYQVGMFSFQAGGGVYGSALTGRIGAQIVNGKKFK